MAILKDGDALFSLLTNADTSKLTLTLVNRAIAVG